MSTHSLLKSQNWRFYSVLIILSVTIFIFGYNTFIISTLTDQNTNQPQSNTHVTHMHAQHSPKLRELQHKSSPSTPNHIVNNHNMNISRPKYNAPSQLQSKSIPNQNIIYHPDGYIIGNPLLIDECKNAVINQIPNKMLKYFPDLLTNIHPHWFVSRESYSALFSHNHHEQHYKTHSKRKKMRYHSKTKVQTPIVKGFNNTHTTSYFNIEKSASSTTTTYLKRQKGDLEFEQTIISSGQLVISNCSFTFVRDPLQRFVSAYYTVNRLMWDVENHPEKVEDHKHIANLRHLFKFLSVKGEPERFRAFVDDLSIFESVFIFGSRHLQHIMSQSAILSLPNLSQIGNNIEWFIHPNSGNNENRFFIGKVEQYEKHWKKLMEVCEDITMYNNNLQLMPSYGARETLNKTYLKVMSLDKWKKGDVLPAYYAVDNFTFAKIYNFYYQDYICFGYEPKLPDKMISLAALAMEKMKQKK
eukprot:12296_1